MGETLVASDTHVIDPRPGDLFKRPTPAIAASRFPTSYVLGVTMRTFNGRVAAAAVFVIYVIAWLSWPRAGDGDSDNSRAWSPPGARSGRHANGNHQEQEDASLMSIRNTTLGFEKIFAIGFSDRSDKHDAMTLGASYTGLDVDWIEGVRSQEMNPKAYPAVWTEEKHREKPAELGSWRAHMNTLRHIVENKISTALVMEDDSDWDVNLKSQMLGFARGTRALQAASKNQTSQSAPFSPYGDDWDMLWLGHCGMNSFLEAHDQDKDQPTFYVIPNDPTVRPVRHKAEFVQPRLSESTEFEEHTRLVFIGEGPICSWSLAFTYDGARKALAALSFIGVDEPVDLGYNFLCSGILNVPYTCYSTYPSLMGTWQQQGPSSRDSDIMESEVDPVEDWHEASSRSLVYSTMLNLMRLARNESSVKAQWEDVSPGEVDLGRLEIPEGYLYENAL